MRKLLALMGTLFVSTYGFASPVSHDISAAIQQGFYGTPASLQKSIPMAYSGKDISRAQIAVADEKIDVVQFRAMG